MAAQNCRNCSRVAVGERPEEGKGARPDRAERRFGAAIVTSSVRVLRRPLESALGSAVGMVDEATTVLRVPFVQGLFESVQDEAGLRQPTMWRP